MNEIVKHAIGRPSLYCPEVLDAAKFYFQYWKDMEQVVPSIEGLASYLKIGLRTIQGWAHDDDKQDFLRTLEAIKTEQALVLINQGLKSEINATIGKLMLSNHGYHDRIENANYDMGGNAPKEQWSVSYPTHEQVTMEKIQAAQAKLDTDKAELTQERYNFAQLKEHNNGHEEER